MKIAMLGSKAVPAGGGIERYVEHLGRRLVERGHEVAVYCRRRYLEPGEDGWYRGMKRIFTPGIYGKYTDAATHTLTAATHAVRQDFDVYHVHGSAQCFILPFLKVLGRHPVVATIHALDWQGSKWGPVATHLMRNCSRLPSRFADELTAVSYGVHEYFAAQYGRPGTVIPTGAELPELREPQEIVNLGIEPSNYILCVSRLVPEKGVHYLVKAYEELQTEKQLVIAGDCPYKSQYERELRTHSSDKVRFIGFVTGRLLEELYSNAYVVVQPSELEGMSLTVLEAMSYGRCVLASDIPANLECLDGCGYTFKARDSADLRDKLQYLLADPDLVKAQLAKARQYVRLTRNWDITAERFEALYESLVVPVESTAYVPAK